MSAELPTSKTQCICPEGLKGFELHCRSCHPDEQPSSNALFNRMWLDYCDSGPCDRAAAFKRIVGTEIERLQQDNARYENGRVVLTGEIDRLRMAERHNVHTVAKLQQERDQLRIKYANMFSALNAKQAKIDALMLEFCPGEMSAEQRAEWTQAQRSPPEPSPSASNDEVSNERLVELLASCIFQSECGGHADGYIAFLCDVATVCMELQRRRAAPEPCAVPTLRAPIDGPFEVWFKPKDGRRGVMDDRNGITLTVHGFVDDAERRRYCEELASTLNGSTAQPPEADAGCICKGNWRSIVKEVEPLIGKEFRNRAGNTYRFFGVVHGDDDYYYGMADKHSMRLLSCVGSLDGHGYRLASSPPAKCASRTDEDYAIEHGRYLADAVDAYIAAHSARNVSEVIGESTQAENDAVTDCWVAMRDRVYEFRKRADRAAATKSGDAP